MELVACLPGSLSTWEVVALLEHRPSNLWGASEKDRALLIQVGDSRPCCLGCLRGVFERGRALLLGVFYYGWWT